MIQPSEESATGWIIRWVGKIQHGKKVVGLEESSTESIMEWLEQRIMQ